MAGYQSLLTEFKDREGKIPKLGDIIIHNNSWNAEAIEGRIIGITSPYNDPKLMIVPSHKYKELCEKSSKAKATWYNRFGIKEFEKRCLIVENEGMLWLYKK